MVVYGCMTGTLNKKKVEDISPKQPNQILKKNNVTIESLPGSGNMGLKQKKIKPCVNEKILFIFLNKNSTTHR